MQVIFCKPEITMQRDEDATIFFNACQEILNQYIVDIKYVSSPMNIHQLLVKAADEDDIFVFFNSMDGKYSEEMIKLITKFYNANSRVWAIAMNDTPACRIPPAPISEKQSFDVTSRNENRNPLKNNMRAIAQIFARKIVAQVLSPLYQDEVLYFLSHRRSDGEHIAARLADELMLLTRERNVYRDVVRVKVGDDAQKDIDRNLKLSDIVIFLQTKEAKDSEYIMKELCYALVNDIPVLWIQIDNAQCSGMRLYPGEGPVLSYLSEDFDCPEKLIEIAEEIEEKCFQLIMHSSNQVLTYIEYLNNLESTSKIKLTADTSAAFAYEIEYKQKNRDLYDNGLRKHYLQCFGRNPKDSDVQIFVERIKNSAAYCQNERCFLLSNHGQRERQFENGKIIEENYNDYIMNLENAFGIKQQRRHKRIIISGAFPDSDRIYNNSLIEAVVVYAREIIKNGYTLVFGSHPTFQEPLFKVASLYASDVHYSLEMHMSLKYIDHYDKTELEEKCTLILSEDIQKMREKMICQENCELMICLGGKIKDDKSQQGVDAEVALARQSGIPVALVGTVGGRSSEYAYEMLQSQNWSELNDWGDKLNEELFYNVNHKVMIKKLLERIEDGSTVR